jgi:hypothetical protein
VLRDLAITIVLMIVDAIAIGGVLTLILVAAALRSGA